MHSSFDGRFAPSPTGDLHVGNLRTALVAWCRARSHDARFLLRIDDLDPDRSRAEHELGQLRDLRAIGIDWDTPEVRQTDRLERYREALASLEAIDAAYPCFCSRADVRAAASAPHAGDGGAELAYPGTCSHLDSRERARRIAAGTPHSLRVRASGFVGAFDDLLLGTVRATVDDFVVRRRDGVPAYNLATVLDEADLGIGEVVRGADLAETTVRQRWLASVLEVASPARFAHVPLVVGTDGSRLAKRHGAVTLPDLARAGIDASQVVRHLAASLGQSVPSTGSVTAADLLRGFDLDAVPRTPVVLDLAVDPSDP